jgi:hypothetical protein
VQVTFLHPGHLGIIFKAATYDSLPVIASIEQRSLAAEMRELAPGLVRAGRFHRARGGPVRLRITYATPVLVKKLRMEALLPPRQVLTHLQGRSLAGRLFKESIQQLQQASCPLTLRFRHPGRVAPPETIPAGVAAAARRYGCGGR